MGQCCCVHREDIAILRKRESIKLLRKEQCHMTILKKKESREDMAILKREHKSDQRKTMSNVNTEKERREGYKFFPEKHTVIRRY